MVDKDAFYNLASLVKTGDAAAEEGILNLLSEDITEIALAISEPQREDLLSDAVEASIVALHMLLLEADGDPEDVYNSVITKLNHLTLAVYENIQTLKDVQVALLEENFKQTNNELVGYVLNTYKRSPKRPDVGLMFKYDIPEIKATLPFKLMLGGQRCNF